MKEITTLPAKSVKVKKSSAGLGLYATVDIPKKTWIIEYTGKKVLNKDVEQNTTKYLFEINNRWTIDGGARTNTARYINHACKPNAEPEIKGHRIYIQATKNIKAGEEITYNYGKEYFNKFIKPYGCRCASCALKKLTVGKLVRNK
ncbi:MAG: SET domain-containing protein [Minisyncoccia bacterium]